MADIVLLIGNKDDPHIQQIKKELNNFSQKCIIIDKFLPSTDSFRIKFDQGNSEGFLKVKEDQFAFSEIKSVWNSSSLNIVINSEIPNTARPFIQSEWMEGVRTLWKSISVRWINHPDAIIAASNRLSQLRLAFRLGLSTPKSLVTNDPLEFTNFYNENNRNIIAKTLSSNMGVPDGKMIFTTKITEDDLNEAAALKLAPCLFQEYIPKKTEYRITIIGNSIHSAEIFSQNSTNTAHDWRRYQGRQYVPHVASKLSDSISDKLLAMMKTLHLDFGAFDLIKTPNDELVFLEVNPSGSWLWIQNLTGMNIARDIAEYLSRQ